MRAGEVPSSGEVRGEREQQGDMELDGTQPPFTFFWLSLAPNKWVPLQLLQKQYLSPHH